MTLWRKVCAVALLALCRKLLAAAAVNGTSVDSSADRDEFRMWMEKRNNFLLDNNKKLRVFEHQRKCNPIRDFNYLCNRDCHISVLPEAEALICSVVDRDAKSYQQCYGQPIAYNHTVNVEAKAQLERFTVLQRFPRCWSKLAPLICAVTFRPCQRSKVERTLHYEDHNGRPNTNNTEVIRIVYQIFAKKFCTDAMSECAFAVEAGMWPGFISCDQQIDPKHIAVDVPLNETRTMMPKTRYSSLKNSTFKSECVWPLVGVKNIESGTMHSVIDNCYLPCRSPLFETEDAYVKSRWMNSIISSFLAFIFAAIGLYLWLLSQAYLERYEVFLLTQAFLCAVLYYMAWALLSIDQLADNSVCSADGITRLEMTRVRLSNVSSLKSLFSLCAIQAALFLCMPMCAFAWLNAFIVYRSCAFDFRVSDFILFWNEKVNHEVATEMIKCDRLTRTIGCRRALIMGIYSFGVAIALLTVVAFEVPVDGIMRACHFGAQISQSSHNLYLTYIPLLVINLLFTAVVIVRYFSRRRITKNKKAYESMIPPANALNAACSSSEQSSSSKNPLLLTIISRQGENARQQRMCFAIRYTAVHYTDHKLRPVDALKNVLEDGVSRSLITDRSVVIIFLSNVAFFCLGLFTLLNTSQFDDHYERNTILDSILCSIRSKARSLQLNGATVGCKIRYLRTVDTLLMSAVTLVAPALPFFIAFCCIVRTFLCGKSQERKSLRLLRRKLFRFSGAETNADAISISLVASNSKISLKGQNSATNELLDNQHCKSYEKLMENTVKNRRIELNQHGHFSEDSQHSPTANSTNESELSEKIQLLLDNQLLLQQQLQQQQQRLDSSPIFFDSSSATYRPHSQAAQPIVAGWQNHVGGHFVFGNSPMPLSVSPSCLSPNPLQYYNTNDGMAPPVYSLPQQPYYISAAPPSPSTQYALWNPYGHYLSASHGDVNSADGYPIRPETYDPLTSPTNVASSLANSDPIHKSGERKIDLNRNYRTHVIHKLMHERYQKQPEQGLLFPGEAASIISGNSNTTLNMTSVSQQPSVVPAVHPAVANAFFEFFKQGVEHGEHKMKHRVEEMTNALSRYHEQLKQLMVIPSNIQNSMGTLMEMGPLSSSATSSGHQQQQQQFGVKPDMAENLQPIPPQIPMIFGAEGLRQMREYQKRNSAEISSVSCPNYFPNESSMSNGGERHTQTVDGQFVSNLSQSDYNNATESLTDTHENYSTGHDAIKKSGDGELDDDTSCDENASDFLYASDELGDETEDGEETDENVDRQSIARSGLSDDFNSDVSDPEEEKIYNIQMGLLKKINPAKLPT